jgi:oligopeptide transport system ATP-binding protein
MTELLSVRELRIDAVRNGVATPVVDGVSFVLHEGEILGVCGESGSGKTLTSLAILGLLPRGLSMSGSVRYRGEELVTASEKRLRAIRGNRIAVVWQDPASTLHPLLPIGTQLTEHVRFHLGLGKGAAHTRALDLLQAVRVPDAQAALGRRPHEFSGGLRQRIAIAIALACDPEILLADEPTTALDVTVQAGILRLLDELVRERRLACILVSHDLGAMSAASDRIQVMYAGRILESGPSTTVIPRPRHPYTEALLAALPTLHSGGKLLPIRGAAPTPGSVPVGCAFHPRCAYARPECSTAQPSLVPVGDRLLACPVDPFESAVA